jgi:hypothetical protein
VNNIRPIVYKRLYKHTLIMKRAFRVRTKTVIHETPTIFFGRAMQKFIQNEIQKKNWIYKIIAGDKEQDQVLFHNNELLILPDTESLAEASVLNWMVIFKDTSLHSIRSLESKHIEVLESVFTHLNHVLPSEHDRPMIYFHYPPSVWQLHLHIAAPCDNLRTTNSMQKVYFLQDVISHLKINGSFYKQNTMTYILPSSHELTCLTSDETDTSC